MANIDQGMGSMPVVTDPTNFDRRSGNQLERLVFNNRLLLVLLCALATIVLGYSATRLTVNASFENMVPVNHPFVVNYQQHKSSLRTLGNSVSIVIENTDGDIYQADYLETLQKINDAVFLLPGVDRSFMKSLWTPRVRWNEVTEEGFRGGPVMPDDYDGSDESIARLKQNIGRAGIVGSIVGNDLKSSTIFVPLIDKDAATGEPLDYSVFAHALDDTIEALKTPKLRVHITGFAQLVSDLIDGLTQIVYYFGFAAVIAAIILFLYTGCVRSTALVLLCSFAAVVWQLGIIRLLGFDLDPYSVLVPFLVFAVGVSHGAQKMNGIMADVGRGTHRYVAARYTFRRLFVAGVTALLADVVGFGVLMLIDIPVIQDLALTASVGIAVLIFTNLLLLPVLLSYLGVSPRAAARSVKAEQERAAGTSLIGRTVAALELLTRRRWASIIVLATAVLWLAGGIVSQRLQVGDLDPGAPELRTDSDYNRDVAYVNAHYERSSDLFAVIVSAPSGGIGDYSTLVDIDRLDRRLRAVEGVQSVASVSSAMRFFNAGNFEGNPKWMSINRERSLNSIDNVLVAYDELLNANRTVAPVLVYLEDHRADTLSRVVDAVQAFADQHNDADQQFLLAAGPAGIEAATNIVVEQSNRRMLFFVYTAVVLLCLITFRSWRAVLVAVIPLMVTSTLCEALMVTLGIGVKVATLPVIALGVGIGVDYALYLVSVQLAAQRRGATLGQAYCEALGFTGRVVALVGLTLAGGVVTWAWSPIKFQADMGILLTFMFLWNMFGALLLTPALSYFLLRGPQDRVPPPPATA